MSRVSPPQPSAAKTAALWVVRTAPVLAILAAVAGCSSGRRPSSPTTSVPPTRPTTSTVPTLGTAPLTGLAVTDPSVLAKPAVIVKIDDVLQARPQAGIDQADVIVEERVEGGLARLMAIFQSHDAPLVGPVRSVRSTDAPVVRPIGGLFAYSGGIPAFVRLLRTQGGVVDVGVDVDTGAYERRSDRVAPHNLYTSTLALRAATPAGMGPPPRLFAYLPSGQPFGGVLSQPATHVSVALGQRSRGDWQWDPASGTWLRSADGTPHTVENGGQLSFATVVIQFVPYVPTPYTDQAHARVDAADVIGSGEAWILAAGRLVKGRWSKPDVTAVTAFTDAAGAPVLVPPGREWISLAPLGASVTVS